MFPIVQKTLAKSPVQKKEVEQDQTKNKPTIKHHNPGHLFPASDNMKRIILTPRPNIFNKRSINAPFMINGNSEENFSPIMKNIEKNINEMKFQGDILNEESQITASTKLHSNESQNNLEIKMR